MAVEITEGPKSPEVPSLQSVKVSSAPATTEALTPEQKRQRFAELRARMGRSMTEVKGPAGKTGYWARKDDANELGRLEYLGFKIVKDNPKSPVWKANGPREDGTYIVGDVILLEIDSDIYQFLLDENVERGRQMIEGANQAFNQTAAQTGTPTFDPASKKGR